MERRIQSIKCINENILDKIFFERIFTLFEFKVLIQSWMERFNVLDEIYGKRGHVQLIQRSGQLLKQYYRAYNTIPINVVWEQISDPHTKIEIYSNIRYCSGAFSPKTTEQVIFQIIDNYKEHIQVDDLDLIVDLFNFKYEQMENSNQIIELLMRTICINEYYI